MFKTLKILAIVLFLGIGLPAFANCPCPKAKALFKSKQSVSLPTWFRPAEHLSVVSNSTYLIATILYLYNLEKSQEDFLSKKSFALMGIHAGIAFAVKAGLDCWINQIKKKTAQAQKVDAKDSHQSVAVQEKVEGPCVGCMESIPAETIVITPIIVDHVEQEVQEKDISSGAQQNSKIEETFPEA